MNTGCDPVYSFMGMEVTHALWISIVCKFSKIGGTMIYKYGRDKQKE